MWKRKNERSPRRRLQIERPLDHRLGEHGLAGDGDSEFLDSGSWDALWGREAECETESVCIRCEGLDRAQQLWEDLVSPVEDRPEPPTFRTPWQWATQNDWDTSQTQSIIAANARKCLGR